VSVSKLGREKYSVHVSESLAVLAWALAATGAGANAVESALKEAFERYPETTIPPRAEAHYFSGHAYAELGNQSESQRHLHRDLAVVWRS
jgi:hypothetical protein